MILQKGDTHDEVIFDIFDDDGDPTEPLYIIMI